MDGEGGKGGGSLEDQPTFPARWLEKKILPPCLKTVAIMMQTIGLMLRDIANAKSELTRAEFSSARPFQDRHFSVFVLGLSSPVWFRAAGTGAA